MIFDLIDIGDVPIGRYQQMAVGIREFVHHHKRQAPAMQHHPFAVLVVFIRNAKDAIVMRLVLALQIAHPPGRPQMLYHESSFGTMMCWYDFTAWTYKNFVLQSLKIFRGQSRAAGMSRSGKNAAGRTFGDAINQGE